MAETSIPIRSSSRERRCFQKLDHVADQIFGKPIVHVMVHSQSPKTLQYQSKLEQARRDVLVTYSLQDKVLPCDRDLFGLSLELRLLEPLSQSRNWLSVNKEWTLLSVRRKNANPLSYTAHPMVIGTLTNFPSFRLKGVLPVSQLLESPLGPFLWRTRLSRLVGYQVHIAGPIQKNAPNNQASNKLRLIQR